eukprot:g8851.t1
MSSFIKVSTFDFLHGPKTKSSLSSSDLVSYSETTSNRFGRTTLEALASVFASNDALGRIKVIGGLARSRLSCVSWGSKRADCFYRGEDDSVFQHAVLDGKPLAPVSIGGIVHKDVQCVTMSTNKIDCIISNRANAMLSASWTGDEWSDWVTRSGYSLNEVGRSSCTRRGDDVFNCIVRVPQDFPARFGINRGTFSGFGRLGGTYHSPFSCVSRTMESIDCYALCYNNMLCSIQWRNPGGWSRNIRVGAGTTVTSEPTSVVSSETKHHIFSTIANNRMVHVIYNEGTGFSDPVTVSDFPIIESPECVAVGDEELYCFALGFDHLLYEVYFDGSTWSDWKLLGGAFLESPSCVLYDTSQIYCFARSFKSSLVKIVFDIKAPGLPV